MDKKMYRLMRDMKEVGYCIKEVLVYNTLITIKIAGDDIDITQAARDYEVHAKEALERARVPFSSVKSKDVRGNNIVQIEFSNNERRVKRQLENFLRTYPKILRREQLPVAKGV